MYRDDDLGNGGHAHHIRADRAKKAVLGGGLQVGPGDRDIDSFSQHDAELQGRLPRDFAQTGIVGRGHIGKAGSHLVVVGPHQRIVPEQVDVIGDQDQVAGPPERIHPAAGVGDDERRRSQGAQYPHREGDLLHGVAFVPVEAALHRHHLPATQLSEQQPSRVSLDRGKRETGNSFVPDFALYLDLARQAAETGPENHGNFGTELGLQSHRIDGPGDIGRERRGHADPPPGAVPSRPWASSASTSER